MNSFVSLSDSIFFSSQPENFQNNKNFSIFWGIFNDLYYKFGLRHFILVFILILYILLGALLFYKLEAPAAQLQFQSYLQVI